jgi:aryl-alcohol dehydrogenase-like predicted oxidoreductase
MPRLVIGTAQWGLNYGVTNTAGKLSDTSIEEILKGMAEANIQKLDTAAAYGDAESRIARLVPPHIQIQTKISGKNPDANSIIERITTSLHNLGRSCVESVVVHDWHELSPDERKSSVRQLEQAQTDSLTEKIGISIYEVDELISAHQLFAGRFVAQIPINLLDQRFVYEHDKFPTVDFQARSIFLQGLLIESVGEFSRHPDLVRYERFNDSHGMSPLHASLLFISHQTWLESVVIAPTSLTQLQDLHAVWNECLESGATPDFQELASRDPQLIDPRSWN